MFICFKLKKGVTGKARFFDGIVFFVFVETRKGLKKLLRGVFGKKTEQGKFLLQQLRDLLFISFN